MMSCFHSTPALGLHHAVGCKQGKGCQRFSLYTSCVCSGKLCWKWQQAWPVQGGLWLAWEWGVTMVTWGAWCLSRSLCQTAPSAVSSLCSSGAQLGLRHDEDALLPVAPSCKTSWMPGSSWRSHPVARGTSAKPAHALSPGRVLIVLRDAADNGVDGMLGSSS